MGGRLVDTGRHQNVRARQSIGVRSVCRKTVAAACAIIGMCSFFSAPSWAQQYPDKTIRLVLPWPAGSITDVVTRIVARGMSEKMAQSVIVENKAGANGIIGAEFVARSAPDGYTLLLASGETLSINPWIYPKLSYSLSDFVAIGPFALNSFALVGRLDLPVSSTNELANLVKASPGKLTFGSAGIGSTSQVAMELFKKQAGLELLHIPYQGGAPAEIALLGGSVDLVMMSAGRAATLRKSGKLKVFGMTTGNRFFQMPDIPTLVEQGMLTAGFANWFGIMVPARTPASIVQRLVAEMSYVMKSPDTRAALQAQGVEPFTFAKQEEFQRFVEAELARWGEVIRGANIRREE